VGCGIPAAAGALAATTSSTPPSIARIWPNNGAETGGTVLTITGAGFTPGTLVRLGLAPATQVLVQSPTRITARSPPGSGLQGVSVANASGTSLPSTVDQFAYDPPPSSRWLGLDDNTAKYLGPIDDFSLHGIVYDRSFELQAGELPSEAEKGVETAEFERRLAEDHEDGMTPVAVIEYKGYDRAGYAYEPDPEFPQPRTPSEEAAGKNTISAYVAGFVKSASAILALIHRRYPGMQVLLEPMNEPWGYTTPQYNGGEYANVIAALLPAAREAAIPTQDIYVAANGKGWVPAMYRAQPRLGSEIEGWYFHPYGPPAGAKDDESEGIETLPLVQAAMTSGQNNIMVSEVGYCAEDVNNPMNLEGGANCHDFSVKDSTVAATDLSEMLGHSRPYHEAGWLRVLIVYSRNDGGWGMENFPELTLTRSGEAFESFADVESRGLSPQVPIASPAGVERELFESGIPCGLCSLTAIAPHPANGGEASE
jgi:hypothetical protein